MPDYLYEYSTSDGTFIGIQKAGPEEKAGTAFIDCTDGWLPPSEFPALFKGLCEAAGLNMDELEYMFREVDAAFDKVIAKIQEAELARVLHDEGGIGYWPTSRRAARAIVAAGWTKTGSK
jgi:hypothetical protein